METTTKTSITSVKQQWDSLNYNWDWPAANGSFTQGHQPVQMFAVWQNGTSGFKNPYWKSQIRNGRNATTSFSGTFVEVTPSWFSAQWRYSRAPNPGFIQKVVYGNCAGYNIYPFTPGNPFVPGAVQVRVQNRCLRKFLDSCENARSSFEAGQDLGEYKETLHSIHRPLGSLQSSILDYIGVAKKLRRSVSGAKKLAKTLADTYLEFHFGWQPLAADVASLIADAQRYRFPIIPVRGSARERFATDLRTLNFSIDQCPYSTFQTYSAYADYSVRYKGAMKSGSDASGRIGLAQSLQLTPENWLPTAWDLIPYSWIVDYFINVGDIIRSLTFCWSNLIWSCKGVLIEQAQAYGPVQHTPLVPPVGWVMTDQQFSCDGGNPTFRRRDFQRSPINASDLVARLEFRVPVSKYPYANIGALLTQALSK
jgi:hypothetical protein